VYFRLLAFLPCNLDLMNFLPWINKDLLTLPKKGKKALSCEVAWSNKGSFLNQDEWLSRRT